MKLLSVEIINAESCGGLLDGLRVPFKSKLMETDLNFEPYCLIGPNGSGKSQLIQVIAEIFQAIFHAINPQEERKEVNPKLEFKIEYLITPKNQDEEKHVCISRVKRGRKLNLTIDVKDNNDWLALKEDIDKYLPRKVIGYTSGENETLSSPFYLSRRGYADDIASAALKINKEINTSDTRLMLIDYSTNLEVLVSNLLYGSKKLKKALLFENNLEDLDSFRCIIQLAHSDAPGGEVKLTEELNEYIDQLKRSSTCFDFDASKKTYTFDFYVDKATQKAFKTFWTSALHLYSSLHKLAMLNDLAIAKKTRDRFVKDIENRRFTTRLPEPQDEQKIFRFVHVKFRAKSHDNVVDYVSMSDGEHQLLQLLGTMAMVSYSNVLFLLDEPESHFNPKWRVKFLSKILELPTENGKREDNSSSSSKQECLLTTHAPFVPSDMKSDNVLIFSKSDKGELEVKRPSFQTYGSTFDTILEECFKISPPMSNIPKNEIEEMMASNNPEAIRGALKELGNSVDRVYLVEHLRKLLKKEN